MVREDMTRLAREIVREKDAADALKHEGQTRIWNRLPRYSLVPVPPNGACWERLIVSPRMC